MRAPPRRPQPVHHLLNRAGHLNPGGLGTRRPRQDLISQAGYQRSPRGTRKPRHPRHNAGAETSPEHARAAICHRPRSRPATFASVVPMRQRGTLIGHIGCPPCARQTRGRPHPLAPTARQVAVLRPRERPRHPAPPPHQRNTLPSPSRQSSVGSQDSSLPNCHSAAARGASGYTDRPPRPKGVNSGGRWKTPNAAAPSTVAASSNC